MIFDEAGIFDTLTILIFLRDPDVGCNYKVQHSLSSTGIIGQGIPLPRCWNKTPNILNLNQLLRVYWLIVQKTLHNLVINSNNLKFSTWSVNSNLILRPRAYSKTNINEPPTMWLLLMLSPRGRGTCACAAPPPLLGKTLRTWRIARNLNA